MEKTHTPEEVFGAEKVFNYLKIKSKYYEWSSKDGRPVLVEVKKEKVNEQLKMARELAKKLKSGLDAEKVLIEVFMAKYDRKDLDRLYQFVFKSKRKFKPKTRGGHCVDMKIGNHIIPLVD